MPTCRAAGCTLTGALSITTQVTDAVTLIHGPPGCTHHNISLILSQWIESGTKGVPRIQTTGIGEREVIFGGEDALAAAIRRIASRGPPVIFVLSACVTDLIGDDTVFICRHAARTCPVIPVITGGFLNGGFHEGERAALSAIASTLTPSSEAAPDDPHPRVVLVGEKNLEYDVDLHYVEMVRLLGLLSCQISLRMVRGIEFTKIRELNAARCAILREPSLIPLGQDLMHRFTLPVVDHFPVGLAGTLDFLAIVAEALGIPGETAICAEEKCQADLLRHFHDFDGMTFNTGSLYADPHTRSFVDEIVERTGISHDDGAPALEIPTPLPVGTSGVRRVLDHWRRTARA